MSGRVTHGRHCSCSACAREDWTRIAAPCGMHGRECPPMYAPFPAPADLTAQQWREAWTLAAPVVVAANRYVEAEADGTPGLIEDAHTQLLRALTDYKNGGKA